MNKVTSFKLIALCVGIGLRVTVSTITHAASVPPATDTPTPAATSTATSTAQPKTTSEFAEEKLKNGWTHYSSEDAGFALALPPEWIQLKLDSTEMIQAGLKALDPDMAASLSASIKQQVTGGLKFFALDTKSSSGGTVTNANVIAQTLPASLPKSVTLKQFLDLTAEQLSSLTTIKQPIRKSILKLTAGQAGLLTYSLVLKSGSKTVTVQATQYILFNADKTKLYIISIGGSPATMAKSSTLMTRIANTFELLK